jgi:tetratricopeptide (TPR) repeat protein
MNALRRLALLIGAAFFLACNNDPKPAAAADPGMDPELAKLSALLDKNPNNDSLLYQRAAYYYQQDAFDETIRDLSRAIQLDSTRPAYYHLLGDALLDYARPNDSKRALDVMELAARRFPERTPTLLKLSEFQLIVRQHGEALKTLDKILQRDPQNAEAFYMAGRIALDKGDTTNALIALKKSTRFDAGNTDAWIILGRIAINQNDPTAIQYFDNAIRVDSSNLEAREFKGVFYKRRGEYDKAFETYRDIVRRNPDYSYAYFDMGVMYLEQDSLDKAYTHFDIATKTDPLFVKAYYYRGLCSELKGNLPAALDDYEQANGMSPEFKEAKDALARLKKK